VRTFTGIVTAAADIGLLEQSGAAGLLVMYRTAAHKGCIVKV